MGSTHPDPAEEGDADTLRRVLVVDDDADFADGLRDLLEPRGYAIETAPGSRHALKLQEAFDPEVALLDIRLGRASGVELAAELKRRRPNLICIMVTAYAEIDTAVGALRAGADDYLLKPFQPAELLAALERAFAKQRLIGEKEAAEDALRSSHEELEDRVKERTAELESANQALAAEIVERKRAEGALREAHDQLELRVEERTAALRDTNEALCESEERYRELFEESPIGIWESDWSGVRRMIDGLSKRGVKDWRAYFERRPEQFLKAYDLIELAGVSRLILDLYGVPDVAALAEMYGSKVVPPDELEGFREALISFIAGRMESVYEAREHRSDGTGITTRKQLAVAPNHHHDWSCVIYAVADITERKRAEEEIQDSQMRLTDAIESFPGGFILYDAEERLVLCNSKYREFYPSIADMLKPGARLEDVARAAVQVGAVRGSAENVEARLRIRLDQHRSAQVTHEQHLKDGRWLLCSERNTSDGGTVGIRTDITEVKRTEEQLRQAQKMELVGQLTGGIAHDFNNLLAVILGNLELVEEELAGNQAVGKLLRWAIGAVDNAAALTQQLLAFSRKQPLRPRSTRVNELVGKLADLSRRTLGETIEIKTAIAPDLWATYVDPGQLEAALLNVVVNARDAMPEGGGITIETRNRAAGQDDGATGDGVDAGDRVMIAISDTGTGMPPEVIEHVFEPFFTTKDVGEGSGLGLSMVYGIVRQSGGEVTVHSEVGRGTTVRLYLPRADATADSDPAAPERPHYRGHGQTILVVEDDANVRKLAARIIKGLGYRVREAANAASALEILAERPEIELLFTDVVLPGGTSGADLARQARRLRPELHVLYASGYTKDAILRHGRLDEDVALIEKPYRKETLAGTLGTLYQRSL